MVAHAYSRGHKIIYVNNKWVYEDTKKTIDNNRPCIKCGRKPTKKGYDACTGHILNVKAACCGHGIENPYKLFEQFFELMDSKYWLNEKQIKQLRKMNIFKHNI